MVVLPEPPIRGRDRLTGCVGSEEWSGSAFRVAGGKQQDHTEHGAQTGE